MRLIVTGTTGFVGQHLAAWLGNREIDLARIDRRTGWPASIDQWSERLAGADVVIHLAGLAHGAGGAEEYAQYTNSMQEMIVAADRAGVRQFVFISSIAAQSEAVSDQVIDETSDAVPVSAYGIAKLACENMLIESGVPYTILRPVAIFGPGAKGNPAILQRLASLRLPLPIKAIGARRSVVSISQFNEAVDTILLNPAALNQIFVVADEAKTIGQLVADLRQKARRAPGIFGVSPALLNLLFAIAGKREIWRRISEPLIVDSSKLRSLGWPGGVRH